MMDEPFSSKLKARWVFTSTTALTRQCNIFTSVLKESDRVVMCLA